MYTLPDGLVGRLVAGGLLLAWFALGLTLASVGSNVCRWLSGHAAQGVFGIMGSLITGSFLSFVAFHTMRPSHIWRSDSRQTGLRILHKTLAFLLLAPPLLDLVQHSVIVARLDGKWWEKWAAAKSREYKKAVAISGIVCAAFGTLCSAAYVTVFSIVAHIHRTQGRELRIQIPRPEAFAVYAGT